MDREYLLQTVLNGLWISQNGYPVQPFALGNYASVDEDLTRTLENLKPEIHSGRIVKVDHVEYCNAVGLIPKRDSSEMRRITDLSRPEGRSVNDSIPDRTFKFQTIEVAMHLMRKDCYMAVVDIRHAYRHLVITPKDWDLQSFKVGEDCYQDRCCSFGLKIAPEVFTRFTRAILRMMHRAGFHDIMAYLDEFFLTGTLTRITEAMDFLLHLLEDLGFYVKYSKLIQPAPVVKFLGFVLDSTTMRILVPEDKLKDISALIHQALVSVWLPLKFWESLVGKMNFIAKAVYGARTFLRRVLDLVNVIKRHKKRGASVSPQAKKDLTWWALFMERWNGQALILGPQRTVTSNLATDASGTAVGCVFHRAVIYQQLTPQQQKWHINEKELYAFIVAVREWGSAFARTNLRFLPRIGAKLDNTTAIAWINKGSANSQVAMTLLRELFWWSATLSFRVTCSHIPGKRNVIADAASRLNFSKIPPQYVVTPARTLSPQELASIKRLTFI